jgi:secreted PhoX family phosphatase
VRGRRPRRWQRSVVAGPAAQSFEFARNIVNIDASDAGALVAAGHDPGPIGTGYFGDNEFAGATFSSNGTWMFVNVQTPGITFAITGPWNKGTLGGPRAIGGWPVRCRSDVPRDDQLRPGSGSMEEA